MSGTRQRIVSEATDLFLVGGYNATSLRMIADRIGITQAAVYYHFRAKDELLDALLEPLFSSYEQDLGAAEQRTIRERTVDRRALLGALFDQSWQHRDALRLVSGDLSVNQHPKYAPRLKDLGVRVYKLLTTPGDTTSQLLVNATLSMLVGPLSQLPPEEIHGAREVLLDAAIRVLDTPHPRPVG